MGTKKNLEQPRVMPRKFKNVAIVFRPESKTAHKCAMELATWLHKKNLQVYSHPNQSISRSAPKITAVKLKKLDLVVVLGGDGTYLQAVRMLKGQQTPILGVNMGSLGFLTVIRKEDLYPALSQTLDNQMETRHRGVLEIKIYRKSKLVKSTFALNDLVIERGAVSHLINIAIFSENYWVGDVKADGVVVSSPTGSTAYNLSAGGPILHPYVRAIVVSPICPHSLTHRPIIFPDDRSLTFKVLNKNKKVFYIVDGQKEGQLDTGDKVVVKRANFEHLILRRPSYNYFELLRQKLKFGER